MLERLDSRELAEWQAFNRLEPIDHARRIEIALAVVARLIANVNRDRNDSPYEIEDFLEEWGAEHRAQAAAEEDPEIVVARVEGQVDVAMTVLGLNWE